MPRLAFEEPKGRPGPKHHRNRARPKDRVVFLLKTATFGVAAILIGAVVLLIATSNGTKEVADHSPAVPEISSPGDDSARSTSPSSPALVAPPVYTQTEQIVPVRPAPTTPTQPVPPPTTTPSDDDESEFAVIGKPCQPQGAFSFTAEYEPVVCSDGRGSDRPTWQRMF